MCLAGSMARRSGRYRRLVGVGEIPERHSDLDTGKQLTPSDAIAAQLVGHDHPRTYCKPFRSRLKKRFAALASRRA